MNTLPPAIPEVPVSDLPAALAYYRDVLGFTVDWADEGMGLAGLSQGQARVFMGASHYRRLFGTAGPQVIWYNLDSREAVDALYQRWLAAGAKLDQPPGPKPHKLYEFFAFDPDGNVIRAFYDFAWEEK